MKKLLYTLGALAVSAPALANDWDAIPVPVDAGVGKQWALQDHVSDSFNYSAPANGKSTQFYERWSEGFINAWQGPGLTDYHNPNSSVQNGNLVIEATRKPGTNQVYTGAIHSKANITFPVYIETSSKIMDQVLANAVWMLSSDSTQEIDIVEAYGSDRSSTQLWFAERMHLAHHVFQRSANGGISGDYMPRDEGSWYSDGRLWKDQYSRVGVYWRDAYHLEYYIDGELVRTVSGPEIIDPFNYTSGTGLSKSMQIIIDAEDQDWLSHDRNTQATDAELADSSKNRFYVDWIRVYKPVDGDASTPTPTPTAIPTTDPQPEGDIFACGDWHQVNSVTEVESSFDGFVETNKVGAAVAGDIHLGFNASGNGKINYNTVGDWASYLVTVPTDGQYCLEISAATPLSGDLGADISIDDLFTGRILISNTGGWEDYQTFSLGTVAMNAGDHTIKVQSSGSSTWQWNGQGIRLVKVGESDNSNSTPTPTPSAIPTVTPTPEVVAEPITVQAESFTRTGGTFDGFQTYTVSGIGGINWNQRGDWAEYTIEVAADADYVVEAYAASPLSGGAIEVSVGSESVSFSVANTGGWDNFERNVSNNTLHLAKGTHTLMIKSNGTTANTWEWNADRLELLPQ